MIHIAGQKVVYEGRWLRQRCAWCGLTLIDYDLATCASMDGSAPRTWEEGAQVEVNGNFSSLVAGKELSPESCVRMELER